jgi:hypothetical protein
MASALLLISSQNRDTPITAGTKNSDICFNGPVTKLETLASRKGNLNRITSRSNSPTKALGIGNAA